MIHPPTFTSGPLQPHELDEIADLLADIDDWAAGRPDIPEHLRIRAAWWATRMTTIGERS
jgi:hypothetical protein